ncbi:hypothetical protein BS78_06G105200 [Paspalum vaginatum]|nr:hypothetical protein BS78_06G105200 [Paspalum vaginatum]
MCVRFPYVWIKGLLVGKTKEKTEGNCKDCGQITVDGRSPNPAAGAEKVIAIFLNLLPCFVCPVLHLWLENIKTSNIYLFLINLPLVYMLCITMWAKNTCIHAQ